MKVEIPRKVFKWLEKQIKSDKNAEFVRLFLKQLEQEQNPTALKNAKKLQGRYNKIGNYWRWKIKNYRIIGDVDSAIITIHIIEITTRENAYK